MVKKVWRTDGRTDRQTDRQTENTICRAAWSQLKKCQLLGNTINIIVFNRWYGIFPLCKATLRIKDHECVSSTRLPCEWCNTAYWTSHGCNELTITSTDYLEAIAQHMISSKYLMTTGSLMNIANLLICHSPETGCSLFATFYILFDDLKNQLHNEYVVWYLTTRLS